MADTVSAAAAGTVSIGDIEVHRLGLGTNRITDTEAAKALLRRAYELGVNFIDTAYRYQNGASETVIGNTFAPYPPDLLIATKGGVAADGPSGSPERLREDLETSLRRLKTDCIALYQLHRLDPTVPLADSLGALKQFQTEGKIRHIGLSEVTVEQLKEAQTIVPIVSVQNEYNVANRNYDDLVTYCEAHGIVFIPWFPLGGPAGGTVTVEALVHETAAHYGVSAQELALAWLLRRSPVMLPIPGTLSIAHLEDNLRAAHLTLRDEDFTALTAVR